MLRRSLFMFVSLFAVGCGSNPQVEIVTNMGTMKAELYESQAPITVKNFLSYVDKKHYDGLIFHRVIPDFMIQGGGFKPGMEKETDTDPPIKNESYNGLKNERGTLAMARTPNPDSATAQFFINVKDNTFLNRDSSPDKVGYAVFGRLVDWDSESIMDKIRRVRTATVNGHENVPEKDVIIETIRRVK